MHGPGDLYSFHTHLRTIPSCRCQYREAAKSNHTAGFITDYDVLFIHDLLNICLFPDLESPYIIVSILQMRKLRRTDISIIGQQRFKLRSVLLQKLLPALCEPTTWVCVPLPPSLNVAPPCTETSGQPRLELTFRESISLDWKFQN